jgi:hypothetical protein
MPTRRQIQRLQLEAPGRIDEVATLAGHGVAVIGNCVSGRISWTVLEKPTLAYQAVMSVQEVGRVLGDHRAPRKSSACHSN